MTEIKEKNQHGSTLFYIDGNEIKEKNQHGKLLFYIDFPEIRENSKHGTIQYYILENEIHEKNKHGNIKYYIDGDEIVFNDFVDISIAVSAPKGLVVPVIRDAQKLDFAGIESEVIRLALKARDNKLTIPEMTGGTFTITNGGIFGSMLSTPIINAPQSAILGMHNIVERPVAINGQVEIRPIMYLALSYDHRTIDGKQSVSFLVRLKQLLEDPMRMMLSV